MSSLSAPTVESTTKLNTRKTIRTEFLVDLHSSHHGRQQQQQQREQQQQEYSSASSAYSAKSIFSSVVAGYVAGCTGTLVGHPLDSIKVLLQTQSSTPTQQAAATSSPPSSAAPVTAQPITASSLHTSASSGPSTAAPRSTPSPLTASMSTMTRSTTMYGMATARGIALASRIQNLYAGMTGPMLSLGLLQALIFAIYDSTRRVLHRHYNDYPTNNNIIIDQYDYMYNDSLLNVFLASTFAGTCSTVFTSPMMVIKTKQQIKLWGFRQAIRETMNAPFASGSSGTTISNLSKIKNFYIGFGPHLVSTGLGRGIYMLAYEGCKRQYIASSSDNSITGSTPSISMKARMACAATAGMICWASIYPFDVLQNQTYRQALEVNGGDDNTRRNTWQLARQMYNQGGIPAFFRGFGITVLRAGPVAAAVLPIYDRSLEWLTETI